MTNIAIVRSSYSSYGGVEKTTLAIIREMLDMDVNVTLLTLLGQQWTVTHPNLQIVPVRISRGNRLMT
jgi:UDP-glucose:(heptosyl)LPS alpha-1,3-glucosyltransferase